MKDRSSHTPPPPSDGEGKQFVSERDLEQILEDPWSRGASRENLSQRTSLQPKTTDESFLTELQHLRSALTIVSAAHAAEFLEKLLELYRIQRKRGKRIPQLWCIQSEIEHMVRRTTTYHWHDGHHTLHHKFLDACFDAESVGKLHMLMEFEYQVTRILHVIRS